MSKKTIIIIVSVVLVVFLLALGGYLWKKSQSGEASTNSVEDKIVEDFAQMFRSGGVKCEGPNVEMYTDFGSKRMALTSTQQIDGSDFIMHVVSRDGYTYYWTNRDDNGSKFPNDVVSEQNEDLEDYVEITKSPEDFERVVKEHESEFKCKPWSVSDKVFEIPSDIEFRDFSEEMQEMQDYTDKLKDVVTQQCESLEGDEKEKCLQMVGGSPF